MPDQLTVNQYESGQGEGLQLYDYGDSLIWDTFSNGDETQYDYHTHSYGRISVQKVLQDWRWSPTQKLKTVTFRCCKSANAVVDYHQVAAEAVQPPLGLSAFILV